MQLTFRAKWVNFMFTLGPEADVEELQYVALSSADLSPAPLEEAYYEEEEEARTPAFGFQRRA